MSVCLIFVATWGGGLKAPKNFTSKIHPRALHFCPHQTKRSEDTKNQLIMGFTKTIIRAGSGQLPRVGQQVTVHCTGFGKDRDLTQKFWSTKDPGQQPFTFAVGTGQVIKGWDESVIGMSLGEIAKIHCSPDYAYGMCSNIHIL